MQLSRGRWLAKCRIGHNSFVVIFGENHFTFHILNLLGKEASSVMPELGFHCSLMALDFRPFYLYGRCGRPDFEHVKIQKENT